MQLYHVITTQFALDDFKLGQAFYEKQAQSLGDYFFDALLTDIESLHFYAGIHPVENSYHKMLSKRFPYAIYYDMTDNTARIIAILDQRRDPLRNYSHLSQR